MMQNGYVDVRKSSDLEDTLYVKFGAEPRDVWVEQRERWQEKREKPDKKKWRGKKGRSLFVPFGQSYGRDNKERT